MYWLMYKCIFLKKMSTPKRSFKIWYPNEGASINSKDRFKPNLTTIPINIINE